MLQAVMTKPGVIEYRSVERPIPGPDQVVLKIKHIGVCGSDIHVYHGQHPYTRYPVVQGHEVSGIVDECGPGVQGFVPGDPVTFMPQVTCGQCYSCRHGSPHICDSLKVMGFQTGGAAQEYFLIDASKVLKLPESIPLVHAALIEPAAVAVHALRRSGDPAGQRVLVLGAGTIGNLVAQTARALGAAQVMVTDVSPFKLEKARQCGLEAAINPLETDLSTALIETFGPDRADVIFECVGVQATITQAVENARKGSTIVVVGVFGEKPHVDLGLVQDRELNLIGTLMYQDVDYHKAIELVAGAELCLDPLISAHYPFEKYLQAYEAIEAAQGNIMKVMLDLP